MFAQLYNCPVHGDTWHPQRVEIIDTDRDDVDVILQCPQAGCGHALTAVEHDGHPVLHALSEEEMYWETIDWLGDEECEDDDGDW